MSLPTPTFIGQTATVSGKTYQATSISPPVWKNVTDGTHGRRLEVLEADGISANRPSNPDTGDPYFDTTLGIPIFYNGTNWVDALGTVR